MANDNRGLHKAGRAKKDEFYTQLTDIEAEMRHYKDYFFGKIVFCNCDDPYESNFFKYFAMNFNALGLKKLITTCYVTSPVVGEEFQYYIENGGQLSFIPNDTPVQNDDSKHPYKVEITEVTDENQDGRIDLSDVEYLMRNRKNTMTLLDGDGDFRSDECIKLLKQADVVVTNPPFSLFREYVAQLMEYEKDFIIIGNQNAVTYKEIFPLFATNKMWYGVSIHSHGRDFRVPDDYPLQAYEYRTDEKGHKYINVKGVRWFTNIDYEKRHEDLILYKHYTPEEYPKYDNYDAINVNKTAEIPCDYFGVMGVPITFLDKYNPEQFEIVAFRKGNDGKDLVYSFTESSQSVNVERERERDEQQFDRTSEYSFVHVNTGDDKECRGQNQRENHLCENNNKSQKEILYDDVIRPVLAGKKLYRRITIRKRA